MRRLLLVLGCGLALGLAVPSTAWADATAITVDSVATHPSVTFVDVTYKVHNQSDHTVWFQVASVGSDGKVGTSGQQLSVYKKGTPGQNGDWAVGHTRVGCGTGASDATLRVFFGIPGKPDVQGHVDAAVKNVPKCVTDQAGAGAAPPANTGAKPTTTQMPNTPVFAFGSQSPFVTVMVFGPMVILAGWFLLLLSRRLGQHAHVA